MPKGKKRLTQREKAERAAIKKQLQAGGVLPPDKPRLNRKKFAREVWEDFSEMDVYTADFYLRKAIMATVGPELHEVTSEQVGILKLMKLAVETDRFMQQLKKRGAQAIQHRGVCREGLQPGHEFIGGFTSWQN